MGQELRANYIRAAKSEFGLVLMNNMEKDGKWSRVHAGLEIQDFGNLPACDEE